MSHSDALVLIFIYILSEEDVPRGDHRLGSKPLAFPLLKLVTDCCRGIDIGGFVKYFYCFPFRV